MNTTLHVVAPMQPHQLFVFLLQAGVLLGLVIVFGRLAARFGLSAVAGELLVGVLLGPSVFGRLAPGPSEWLLPHDPAQLHLLDAVGQFGVVLLVGVTGIHMDLDLVRRRGATAAAVSVPGLVIPLVLGAAAGYLAPAALLPPSANRAVFASYVGVALCVASIPVVAKILMDMNLLHRNVGQFTLIASTVSDVVGWVLLSVVAAAVTAGVHLGRVGLSLAYVAGVVVFAATVGRVLVRAVLRAAARASDGSATTSVVVVLILLSAAATEALGLEAVFGAFVCGIVVGSSPELDRSQVGSLRAVVLSVLAPVFFATAGLRTDFSALGRPVVLVGALVLLVLAVVGKFGAAFVGTVVGPKSARLTGWEALALGAGINTRGIIAVIVATVGLQIGILNTVGYTIIVLVAIVTSMMAPPILRWAMSHIAYTDDERRRGGDLDAVPEVVAAAAG